MIQALLIVRDGAHNRFIQLTHADINSTDESVRTYGAKQPQIETEQELKDDLFW